MQSRMMIERPGEVEVTLKLTMPAKEWENLREQLVSAYPSWTLAQAITDMLVQVRKIIYPTVEPES